LVLLSLICGFLCSETFLFQVPAAMVSLVVLQYYARQKSGANSGDRKLISVLKDYTFSAFYVLPRLIFMVAAMGAYLGGRYYFDTLDIPEALIRPAENPFYHFKGEHRVRNYMYTLAVHVAKSWGLDPIGFSHEYGFDCVSALESWEDPRLALPAGIAFLLSLSLILALRYPRALLGPVLIHWAWLMTLFPISGVLKVGTFISDRIVVASSVSVCLWVGFALYYWATKGIHKLPAQPLQGLFVGWLLITSYMKIHNRSLDWMDSISLMESSLETCPNFAKVHMETSKIYSGLYPNLRNLGKARHHLNRAREIDPNLCDVHQQYAHVAIQQNKYLEYEREITEAILCPFTMGGALEMWKRYWPVALASAMSSSEKIEIQARQEEYSRKIQEHAMKQQQEEERVTRR
jgi:hypothetical protein